MADTYPLSHYVYLDVAAVESLFAQTTQEVEIATLRRFEEAHREKVAAKVGLSKAIATLLGLDIGASIDADQARREISEIKSSLSVEQRLRRLLDYLADQGLRTDLNGAIQMSRTGGGNLKTFISIYERFDLPQYAKKKSPEQVERDGAILFATDQYAPCRVQMLGGLSKFPQFAAGSRNRLSHFAMMAGSMANLPLNVFGLLTGEGNDYYIKPFAIWP